DSTLRGIGQIIFQNNRWSGALFLLGVATGTMYSSNAIWMTLFGVIGSLAGAVLAVLARRPLAEVTQGLHGFNPSLVGMVTFFWYPANIATISLAMAGMAVAWGITHLIRRTSIPGYTLPFILVGWAIHWIGGTLGWLPLAGVVEGKKLDFMAALLEGFSEIMLIGGGKISGIFFLLGILVGNRWHGVLAFMASAIGLLVAVHDGDPVNSVNLGLYGYNAILTAIAMSFVSKEIYAPICGAFLSVILVELWSFLPIPALTAPFVIATWMLILVRRYAEWFHGHCA
ncbi:MAG: urea transporter, partial [Gemmataceae bacterium]